MKDESDTSPEGIQVDLISGCHNVEDGINDAQMPDACFWIWPDHGARKRLVLENDVLNIVFSTPPPSPAPGVCDSRMSIGNLRTRTSGC